MICRQTDTQERRSSEDRSRDYSDPFTSEGVQVIAGNQQKLGGKKESSLEPSEGAWPLQHLGLHI